MRVFKFFFKLSFFGFLSIFIFYLGINIYAFISPNLNITNNGTYYLFDNQDALVFQGSSTSSWVNFENIDNKLIDAVISIEDKKFYNHFGFDVLRIGKAMVTNVKTGHIVQGASTITQQLVKNLYLEFDKTWERKFKEAFLTIITEIQYDKNTILEAYLNTINYGNGNYGVSNASRYYFNKEVSNLTLEEAIILAGIPKSPNKYNPVSNYNESINRAKIVAKSMLTNEFIDRKTYDNLNFDDVFIYGKNNEKNLQMLMYYQDAVYKELEELGINKEILEKGSLKIYTNLDIEKQTSLEKNILKNVKGDEKLQVSSVIVDPETGKIEALTGGIDYGLSQFNRATESKRQVGSTMKPILYYAALENNLTSSSKFKSGYTTFNINNKQSYSPTNYNDKYANKDITMAAAIAFSDNIYAVKTNLFLGVDKLVNTSKKIGIKENLQAVPSLALGTGAINIIDYATGYATFASGGYKKDLYLIRKIEDKDGNVIYEKKNKKSLVLNPNYVYILNELLSNTSSSAFRDYTTATASTIASKLSRKYAIKTGTTKSDYWTVGYNKDDLMLIWLGYDDNKEINSYGYMTKNIFADTMEEIQFELTDNWYKTPENIVGIVLDAVTGDITNKSDNAIVYYYLKGSEPEISKSQVVNAN